MVIFLIAVMCGGFAGVILAVPPKSSADWAAWVQAAGSILAIGTSVGLVSWQSYRDKVRARDDARADRFRHLDAALEIVRGLAQVTRMVAGNEFAHSAATFNSMRSDLGALAGALAAIDVTNLSGYKVTESVLVALGAARRLLSDIDVAEVDRFDPTVVMGGLKQNAEEMAEIIENRARILGDAWSIAKAGAADT